MEENNYQIAYYELKSSLKGEKYLGQEVAKLDLGDTILVKSQTKDGKLCWIVENKKENVSPDYIEAFENIIFQKRDNGYISDAYRNDIDVVYEALHKLEKLKNEEIEFVNNNKNKEYIQNDIELTNKLVEETMEEYYDKCGIPEKYRNPNNISGEIKIPTVIKNDLEKLKENKGEEIMKDYSTKYGSNTTVESFSETQKGEEIIMKNNINNINNNELNAQQPICIGGRNYIEEEYEREQEEIRKNIIEQNIIEHFKNSEMNSLSMLADIQYLVINEMDDLRNKWLLKLYFNKIREDLQSFHGTEQASDEEINQLLLQEQQNKAMEIIFNKCRDNVNLLLVNRNDTYDNYNSAFEYQMRTNVFDLKEEDKLTIDEYIDIYEWLKSERIKNGLETVIEKEVDVTEGE